MEAPVNDRTDHTPSTGPIDRSSTWSDAAGLLLIELAAEKDPTFPRTPEMKAAAAALIEAIAVALAGARGDR